MIIAIPSVKLWRASEIRARLPEIKPPTTSAPVIMKFMVMVINILVLVEESI
jgi:hypothetical protein